MKRMIPVWCLWSICAWHASATARETGPLTPPTYSMGTVQIAAMQPFGQSFTATSSVVTSIALQFLNMNMDFEMSQDLYVDLRLHDGPGFSAPLLATSRVNVDSVIGKSALTSSPIYFAVGDVPLTVGSTYSFEVRTATARYGIYWPSMENYDGGNAIFLGEPIEADLHFAVMGAVPEPSGAPMLLAGLPLALLAARHRKRPRAA